MVAKRWQKVDRRGLLLGPDGTHFGAMEVTLSQHYATTWSGDFCRFQRLTLLAKV